MFKNWVDTEDIKRTQIKLIEVKITISEMKNTLFTIGSGLDNLVKKD